MHKKNIIPKVLCLIGSELYNSLTELKDYLDFSLLICEDLPKNSSHLEYEAVISACIDVSSTLIILYKCLEHVTDMKIHMKININMNKVYNL